MAAPGTGIPNSYPLAINTPLERAYLRPLQEPLADTELIASTSTMAPSVMFYQRAISATTATGGIIKDYSETNLNQSSMLDYPREFSILGFNIAFDSTIGLEALSLLYRRAYFVFTFSGRRPYLTVNLNRIPQGQSLQGAMSAGGEVPSTGISGVYTQFANGMAHIANYYKFNLGRSALKIKPGEAFNGKISWPSPVVWSGSGQDVKNNNVGRTNAANGLGGTGPGFWTVSLFTIGLNWSPL